MDTVCAESKQQIYYKYIVFGYWRRQSLPQFEPNLQLRIFVDTKFTIAVAHLCLQLLTSTFQQNENGCKNETNVCNAKNQLCSNKHASCFSSNMCLLLRENRPASFDDSFADFRDKMCHKLRLQKRKTRDKINFIATKLPPIFAAAKVKLSLQVHACRYITSICNCSSRIVAPTAKDAVQGSSLSSHWISVVSSFSLET